MCFIWRLHISYVYEESIFWHASLCECLVAAHFLNSEEEYRDEIFMFEHLENM